jgi:hypothetical protein
VDLFSSRLCGYKTLRLCLPAEGVAVKKIQINDKMCRFYLYIMSVLMEGML